MDSWWQRGICVPRHTGHRWRILPHRMNRRPAIQFISDLFSIEKAIQTNSQLILMPRWWYRILNRRLTRWRCRADLSRRLLLMPRRIEDAVWPAGLHWFSWSDYSFRWWSFAELGHQTQVFLVDLGLVVGALDAAHARALGFTIFSNVTGAT